MASGPKRPSRAPAGSAARKPAAKKPAPRKPAAKKPATKKPAPTKAAAKPAARDRSLEATRKAFARRQRARRWLTWRYLLVGALVLGLVGFGTYAVYFSPWLRTEGVQVTGTRLLGPAQVRAAAEVPIDGPLARVDLEAIERRVESMAAVKDVDVTRKWPHDVLIKVTERTPIAVLELGGRRLALDEAGTAFTVPARVRDGLPRVRVGANADRDALQEGASVIAALPDDVARMVDYLEIRTVDEIVLHLRGGRLVQWGSADRSDDKARVLLALLTRDARVYDVSVPGAPTTR